MAPKDDTRNGVRLRGGLPESNGLSPLATSLVKDETRIVYLVAAVRVAAVTHTIENDSRTASLKIITLEADLTDEEQQEVQLILDRARVRRTGEEALFPPDSVTPITRAPRKRR